MKLSPIAVTAIEVTSDKVSFYFFFLRFGGYSDVN